jgi:hypothetical protein
VFSIRCAPERAYLNQSVAAAAPSQAACIAETPKSSWFTKRA